MLKFLSVENFALIDRLAVEFRQGLNLITGETGSGKSILVDAVGLLVGASSDASVAPTPAIIMPRPTSTRKSRLE